MDLICVNCGAVIAEQDSACSGCGTSRDVSLPPGSVSAGQWTTALAPPLETPAYVEPPAYVEGPSPGPAARPSIGAVDFAVTLTSMVLAFGLGWLVHGGVEGVQKWMVLRSVFGIDLPSDLSGHDLLVVLVTFSPFAVALLAASISRIPGTGVLVVLASFAAFGVSGNGPRVIELAPEFDLDRDWVIVVALAGFVVADLIVAFAERGALAGLVAGALTGLVTAGFVTLYVDRIDSLGIFDEAWLVVLVLVVPALFLLAVGLLGGAIGGLRRR